MQHSDTNILQEQVRLIYKQLPGIMFIPSAGAVLMAVLHWGQIPDNNIYIWLTLVVLSSSGSSSVLFFTYKKYQHSGIAPRIWANVFNLLGLISGVSWGASAYFMYAPDSIVLQMVLILFLFSASSLIALTMTSYRPPFYMVVGPMLIPIVIRLLLDDDFLHIILALTAIVYIIALFVFHFNINQGFVDSIHLWIEKNELARELEQRSIESERENQAKSRFLAAASHDLRQPLVAQDLLLEALNKNISGDDHAELFLKLRSNINSLHSLFNELVEVSKIDTGHFSVNKSIIDIDELMKKVEGQFILLAKEKNIDFNVETYSTEIYADKNLLERILKNLISNAIKYTNKGEVSVVQIKQGNILRIVIEDTGIGIKQADHESVFDEFYRTSEASMHTEGFGLGLAIVKRLAALLEYDLHLESEQGVGTRFLISIPLSS